MGFAGKDDWAGAEVRGVIRVLALAGSASGGLQGRRQVLLDELAALCAAEGWEFRGGNGVSLSGGRMRAGGDELLEWHGQHFTFVAFRAGAVFPDPGKRLVGLVLRHCAWLGVAGDLLGERDATEPRVSLRQAQVLAAMLAGDGRKQIAARLGISINTVSGHVKELYRVHGVNSQAMLVKKLAAGGAEPDS